jgi:hypothetical protein
MGLFGILIGFMGAMIGVVTALFAVAFGLAVGFLGLLLPFAPIVLVVLAIVWLANGGPRRDRATPASSWPAAQPPQQPGVQSPSLHPHAGR